MKIAYDHKIFWLQKYGGISRYFVNLFLNLSLKKIDYKVFAPFFKNEYLKDVNKKNINGKYLNYLFPYSSFLFKKYNEVISSKKIIEWNPNLIHYTYYYEKLKKSDKPTIITIYDLIHEKKSILNGTPVFPKKRMVDIADHIISISQKTKEDLIEIYGVEEKKISVIYLGADHSLINNFDLSQNVKIFSQPYILFIGSRAKYKNFPFFLESYANSNKLLNKFEIILFGGGNLTVEEKKIINKLGIKENLIKQINGNDNLLVNLYKNAELFVFPSLDEGFGIPIIESFINKCPVICSDIPVFREIAQNSVNYFDQKEIESSSEVLENTILSSKEKNTLKEKGYAQSKKSTWEKCTEETLSVYKNFL